MKVCMVYPCPSRTTLVTPRKPVTSSFLQAPGESHNNLFVPSRHSHEAQTLSTWKLHPRYSLFQATRQYHQGNYQKDKRSDKHILAYDTLHIISNTKDHPQAQIRANPKGNNDIITKSKTTRSPTVVYAETGPLST